MSSSPERPGECLLFEDVVLDEQRRELLRGGRPLHVEPKILELIRILARERDRVVSREELMARLWPGVHVSASSLPRSVSIARRLLGDSARQQRVIKTVPCVGYQFSAHVVIGTVAAPTRAKPFASPFVGRSAERDLFHRALADAAKGRGRMLLVVGEAGIGKTRLLETFQAEAERAGAPARFGRCIEVGGAPAFWPWVPIVRSEVESMGDSAEPAEPGAYPDELRRLSSLTRGLAPADSRFALFNAVLHLLRDASRQAPRLIVFDDLHQADSSSLELLRFIGAALSELSVLIVAAMRPVEQQRSERARLLADVARGPHLRAVELGGLAPAEVGALVAFGSERPCPPELAARLHEHTGGNPFFVTQLLPLLDGMADAASGAMPAPPATLRMAVARQLASLPQDTRRLLRVAAIVGRDVSIALLAAIVDKRPQAVAAVLEPARVMRLVLEASDDPTTLRFGHVVVRDVIYQEMAARERARWHLRACTALRGLTASDPDRHLFTLADHAYRAALLDGGRLGFEYAMRAGRRARDQLAYEVAVQHFERAVRLVRPDHDRSGVAQCDAWTALGESQIRAGYRAGAVRSLERAGELARGAGLGEQLARVAMTVAPGMLAIEAGVYDPLLVRLLSEAAAEIGPDDPGRRARILARQALALYWSDQDAQRRRLVEEGTALADRCGDPVAAAEVRVLRIAAQWGPDNVAERERLLPGALAELEAAGSLEESIVIRMYWVTTLIELGRTASIEREIARYDREATLLRQPMTSWVALLFQAMRALDAGRLPEAEAHAEAFLRIGRQADDQNSELSFIAVTWLIRSLQGRFDAAVEINTRGLREYPHVRAMRFALPGTLASAGRRQEARVALDRVAARGFADEAHDVHYLADFSYLADACAELGDAKLGAMLREQLAPYGERTVVVGFGTATRGAVAYYVARLDALCGNVRRAREQFEAAIHRNRAAGAVPWLAATLLRYADFLDQRAIAAKDAMRHRAEGRRLVAEHSLAGLLAKQERAGTDRRHA